MTDTLLDQALSLAAQGLPVFPVCEKKRPTCERGFHDASTDRNAITRLFANPAAKYIGIPTGSVSDIDVLDIDPAGADWVRENEHRLPDTRTNRTRRGGFHRLYRHRAGVGCSAGRVAVGIDVRGDGGYFVFWPAAGLEVYRDGPIAEWPDWLIAEIEAARGRKASGESTEDGGYVRQGEPLTLLKPDLDRFVHVNLDRVANAGEGAKHSTLRDSALAIGGVMEALGLEQGEAVEKLMEALPATVADWDLARVTAEWGLRNGAKQPARVIESEFPALPDEPAADGLKPTRSRHMRPLTPYQWRAAEMIAPRQWLYMRHLIRGYVSATVAPGGIGKSSLSICEALDMVTGRGLFTGGRAFRPLRVLYWCGEDPSDEIERRVAAAGKHYNITAAHIGDRLFLASGRDMPLTLVSGTREGPAVDARAVETLEAELRAAEIDVIIIDPFVCVHTCAENDNSAINLVADIFRKIADRTHAAVELIHHTRKAGSGQAGQDRTADDARGAGALVAAARSVRVLNVMTPGEAGTLGIPDEDRWQYFRVDNGKSNLAPPSGQAAWRRKVSVDLGNGAGSGQSDHVGVVEVWERPAADRGVTEAHVAELQRLLSGGTANRRNVQSPEWAGHALARILDLDAGDKAARRRLQSILDALAKNGLLRVIMQSNGKGRATECFVAGAPTEPPPAMAPTPCTP